MLIHTLNEFAERVELSPGVSLIEVITQDITVQVKLAYKVNQYL